MEMEITDKNIKKSFFTFGFIHKHNYNGILLDRNIIVEINAENLRKEMFELFGDKWAFEYTEQGIMKDLHFYPRGILKIM